MIDLKHAQAWNLCRICEKPAEGDSLILLLNFGEEYAHERCIKAATPIPLPEGWFEYPKQHPSINEYYWLRRGAMLAIVLVSSQLGSTDLLLSKVNWEKDFVRPDKVRAGDVFKRIPRPPEMLETLERGTSKK